MQSNGERFSVNSSGPGSFELIGEIDAHTSDLLAQCFLPLPDVPGTELALDMSRVDFIDSSGLRVLIELNARSAAAGLRLVVNAPSRSVVRLIDISGLSDYFEVGHTERGTIGR